jgi:hypothetical protein
MPAAVDGVKDRADRPGHQPHRDAENQDDPDDNGDAVQDGDDLLQHGEPSVGDGPPSLTAQRPQATRHFGSWPTGKHSPGEQPEEKASTRTFSSGSSAPNPPATRDAVSPAGAIGYTQLMPDTARGLGVNPRDPWQNLVGGARYLKQQLHTFGNYGDALRAYNAGPGAVRQSHGYAETNAYVQKILRGANPAASTRAPRSRTARDQRRPPRALPADSAA